MSIKHETLIISKEAYFTLRNYERVAQGFLPLAPAVQESMWKRITIKNGGANPATHPIDPEREIRIDNNTYNSPWEVIRAYINVQELPCRNDGYCIEYINI